MKRWTALLLSLLLVLSLTACGTKEPTPSADQTPTVEPTPNVEPVPDNQAVPESEELQFFVDRLTWTEDYVGSDGVLLVTARFDLPYLRVQTKDGGVVENIAPYDTEEAQPMFAARNTFNAEMQMQMEALKKSYDENRGFAEEDYAFHQTEDFPWTGNYADELTFEVTLQSDTLLSIVGSGYSYLGGAHPNSYTRTWNYDLTTGTFLTLDDFGAETRAAISAEISRQIDAEQLADYYFEDYQTHIDSLDCANFYFDEQGLNIVFDAYELAPYAAGAQYFVIPYEGFSAALPEQISALLPTAA